MIIAVNYPNYLFHLFLNIRTIFHKAIMKRGYKHVFQNMIIFYNDFYM